LSPVSALGLNCPTPPNWTMIGSMATEYLTDAENFQQFLTLQVATTGRNKSPEELLDLWRRRQREQEETLKSIREGIADIEAGRVYPIAEVADEIRKKHGWSSSE